MSSPQSSSINTRKVAIFLGLAFFFALVIGSIPVLLGEQWAGNVAVIVGVFYMLFPALIAIFVQKVLYHEPVMEPLKVSFRLNRWFLWAWILPVILALVAILVAVLFPGVSYSPDMAGMLERYRDIMTPEQLAEMERSIQQMPIHPLFLTIVQGMIAGITVNALAAFGEELGWRGFLLREFKHWVCLASYSSVLSGGMACASDPAGPQLSPAPRGRSFSNDIVLPVVDSLDQLHYLEGSFGDRSSGLARHLKRYRRDRDHDGQWRQRFDYWYNRCRRSDHLADRQCYPLFRHSGLP